MSDANVVMLVEESELGRKLPDVLKAVECGKWVEVRRGGEPIASIHPPRRHRLTPMHPDLMGVKFNADPVAPLDSQDWPEHLR